MRTETQVIDGFIRWANANKNIRAAVLTSSRANKNAKVDFLSDYDIELYVSDIDIITKNDDWLKPLGEIMVRWPLYPKSTLDNNWITRLLLFYDGVRIDFQITDNSDARLDNIDYGYNILFDKDNILKNLPVPTNNKYKIKRPSKEEYERIVHEFWWDAMYVPKYLWRDELPFAKYMMWHHVQDEFLGSLIKWYIGIKNNWDVSTGICNKYFKIYLPNDIWSQYEQTFTGADIEDNWKSFFTAVELFGYLGRQIGKSLGYEYPVNLEKKMITFFNKIKNT